MRPWIILPAVAALLSACSSKHEAPPAEATVMAEVRVDHQRAAWVAYEHDVELEVPVGQTRPVSESVQKACAALPAHGCTLLEASIHTGAASGATVRMRVTPEGVNKVLAALHDRGSVVSQSTRAEDLAEPIHDGDRKQAMLANYREQLQTLTRQRALDPEALIKLHRELAEVQSEIDNAATAQAQLQRRVDTELLTVAMSEHAKTRRANRVRQAIQDFSEDFLNGLAMMITFVASAMPFAVAGTVGYVVWGRIRARRRGAMPVSRTA